MPPELPPPVDVDVEDVVEVEDEDVISPPVEVEEVDVEDVEEDVDVLGTLAC